MKKTHSHVPRPFLTIATALLGCAGLLGCPSDDTLALCLPGSRICEAEAVMLCAPQTGRFELERICPAGMACVQGDCVSAGTVFTDTAAPGDAPPNDLGAPADDNGPTIPDLGPTIPDLGPTIPDLGPTIPDLGPPPIDEGPTIPDLGPPPIDEGPPLPDEGPTPIDAGPPVDYPPGVLGYAKIGNIVGKDDLYRVKWHPSGTYALILGKGGKVYRYAPGETALSNAGTLPGHAADLDVAQDGSFFLVVGDIDTEGKAWRVSLDDNNALQVLDTTEVSFGVPRAVVFSADGSQAAIAAAAGNSINYLYLWEEGAGITQLKGYNGPGVVDVMWGPSAMYAGSPVLITADGWNGAGSQTWVIQTDEMIGNGWKNSFGNPARGAWRPGGDYGFFAAGTTNKVYAYYGAWESDPIPTVGSAANGMAVAWKADGSRALIVGDPAGNPLKGTIVEYRPTGELWDPSGFLDASIIDFHQSPWFGVGSQWLLDVDWRPGACDEGLIVGADNGASFSPTFGLVVRFWDLADPECAP